MTIADGTFLLGSNTLPILLLAFGAALIVGNLAAYFKPPEGSNKKSRQKPALSRIVPMVVLGVLLTVWAVLSLV